MSIRTDTGPGLEASDLAALYWDFDIPVSEIADLLGCHVGEVHTHVPPVALASSCEKCGADLWAHSRAEWIASSGRRWHGICDVCHTADRKAMREWWARREAEEEQRRRELREMDYADYLRSPEWQDTRRHALRRSGYRCQVCNQEGPLDVHHRTYERLGHEYARDLTVLCRECHARHHEVLP